MMKIGFDFSKVKKAGKAKSLNDLYAGGAAGDGNPTSAIPVKDVEGYPTWNPAEKNLPFTREEIRAQTVLDKYKDYDSRSRVRREIFGKGDKPIDDTERNKIIDMWEVYKKRYKLPDTEYAKDYFNDFWKLAKNLQPEAFDDIGEREIMKVLDFGGNSDVTLGDNHSVDPLKWDGDKYIDLSEYPINTHYHPDPVRNSRNLSSDYLNLDSYFYNNIPPKEYQANPSGFMQSDTHTQDNTGDRAAAKYRPDNINYIVGGLGGLNVHDANTYYTDPNYIDTTKVKDPNIKQPIAYGENSKKQISEDYPGGIKGFINQFNRDLYNKDKPLRQPYWQIGDAIDLENGTPPIRTRPTKELPFYDWKTAGKNRIKKRVNNDPNITLIKDNISSLSNPMNARKGISFDVLKDIIENIDFFDFEKLSKPIDTPKF